MRRLITRRLRLRDLLASREEGYRLDEITYLLAVPRETALSDLKHLQLSLRHREEKLLMVPPACGTCGFTFRAEEPKAPSKCPQCKSKDIELPVFKVEAAEA